MRALAIGLVLAAWPAAASEPPPSEEEIFGAPEEPDPNKPPETQPDPEKQPDAPVEPTSPEVVPAEDDPFATLPQGPIIIQEDPLAIGGQLYLRLLGSITDRGSAGEQALSMPNFVDLYLDARPEDRVRGFVSGRLYYDPTIGSGAANAFGQSIENPRVLLDQLWLKTDIARRVFLTVGQERIKWGSSRIWNPTDFINDTQRDPLALFDERTGVPMLKVHIPIESWNLYVIGLLGGVDKLEDVGAAARLEMAFSSTEISLSALAGAGRKTGFGLDVSTALGDFDLTLEGSLTDEHGTLNVTEPCGIAPLPACGERDAWYGRFTAGLQYGFKVSDEDAQYIGVEYFFNPLGYSDPDIYPVLIGQQLVGLDTFHPFYLGKHYLGLTYVVPGPGQWDDATFSLTGLGNLSDKSFVTRLDFACTLHTRLTLQAFVEGHFGHRGGELHLAIDQEVPAGIFGDEAISVHTAAPLLNLGLNLRIAL